MSDQQGERGDSGDRGVAGERGPRGDHGQHGEAGAPGRAGTAGERGMQGERGLPPRFDWTHLVAYLILSAMFIWVARENYSQGIQIGQQQANTQRCVDSLRADIRSVLIKQIDLRERQPPPTQDDIAESLRQQVVRLEAKPC